MGDEVIFLYAQLTYQALIYRAGEPVFRVTDGGIIHFQGMDLLERGLWADPLLFYALSLAAALAINRDHGNGETLRYRGLLLRELHTSILKPPLRSNVSFAVALLVLIGSEYRTEGTDKRIVERHLRGMHAVIAATATSTSAPRLRLLQRALFWQDLISCLTIDTPRLLSYMTPSDCRYLKSTAHSSKPPLECGFRVSNLICPPGFWTILEDIRNLCRIVDAHYSSSLSISPGLEVHLLEELDDEGYPIDNAQANIESRVVDLLHEARQDRTSYSPLYQACLYAAYLCTYKLSAGLWAGQFVPEICASRILDHVEETFSEGSSVSSTNLLIWLLFTTGGLTETSETRSRALTLLTQLFLGPCQRLSQSWSNVTAVLETLIWCKPVMDEKMSSMWAQLLVET